MSKDKGKQVSEFLLEGRFLDFGFEDGSKLKYLRLATSEGEFWIKLSKELRASFNLQLVPGDWIQVEGERKLDLKKGQLKLKAQRIIITASRLPKVDIPGQAKLAKAQVSILVCQKSDCMKRGGKAICQAIQAALSEHGLENRVAVKGTGCMKKCSSGPNLVMPDKTHYSRLNAAQISEIIKKHFSDEFASA